MGDTASSSILTEWAATDEGGKATTDEFMELAERISSQDVLLLSRGILGLQ